MNIIQTWKTKDIPEFLKPFQNNVLKHKSNWNYLFFDDDDIVLFFKEKMPDYYDFFIKLPFKIQQIDFFRYCAVYFYGGIYLDLDFFLTRPLDPILNYECIFPIELKNINDPILNKHNLDKLIGNYAFYARPKNHFIKSIIDNIISPKISLNDIQIGCQHNGDPSDQVFVYYTTGPVLVSFSYSLYKDKQNVVLLTTEPFEENSFGHFGSHKMYGTWKLSNTKKVLS